MEQRNYSTRQNGLITHIIPLFKIWTSLVFRCPTWNPDVYLRFFSLLFYMSCIGICVHLFVTSYIGIRYVLISAHRGFECQGNEFSLFMLLASNFVLNKCKSRNCFTLYPWIHQNTNNIQGEDMVRPALFPDVNPNDLVRKYTFALKLLVDCCE